MQGITSKRLFPFVDRPQEYMADGIFVGLERKQLEKLRDTAYEQLAEGRNIMSWSDGATSSSKQYAMPPREMLAEALYALRKLDGNVRGLYTNYNRIVDR